MKTHKDLDIWQRGIEFVKQTYEATRRLPREELYGLVSQMRRAVVSYPSNVAEGAARSHNKEFIQFLYVSLGSPAEIETHVMIAEKLGYLKAHGLLSEIEVLRRMTLNFIKYLKTKKGQTERTH